LGKALIRQWHLWLVDSPPSVWRMVVLAAIWAMEQGRNFLLGNACSLWFIRLLGKGLLCSRPFPKLPPPSGLPCMILPGMIGQSQLRAGIESALIILSCLFASRFPCGRSPISINGLPFSCFTCQALYSTRLRVIWFSFVRPQCAFWYAKPCSVLYTWRGWWRGYPALHVATGASPSSPWARQS
jgi:hypothetical protein